MAQPGGRRALVATGLPTQATEEAVRAAFVPYGDVSSVRLTGKTATVTFDEADDAVEARRNLDRAELHGRTIRVRWAAA